MRSQMCEYIDMNTTERTEQMDSTARVESLKADVAILTKALREIAKSTGSSPVGDRFRKIAKDALAKVYA